MKATDQPVISIIIPLYNKEREVSRAIDSALAQTFPLFKLIVVDDGSTDKSASVVSSYQDERIRLIQKENAGVSSARNRGVAESGTDLVAFLDADDEWMPEFIETVIRLRNNFPSCMVFATSYLFCYVSQPSRQAILRDTFLTSGEGILSDYFRVATRSDPPICSSSVAIDKKALLEIGGFPAGIIAGEDLLLWARLAARFDIAYSNRPLAKFWAPVAMTDRPVRIPQQPDVVAQNLYELLRIVPAEKYQTLIEYIALWHKMRSVIFIKLNRGSDARIEIKKAVTLTKTSSRLFLLNLISFLPGNLPSRFQLFVAKILQNVRSKNHEQT